MIHLKKRLPKSKLKTTEWRQLANEACDITQVSFARGRPSVDLSSMVRGDTLRVTWTYFWTS